MEIISSYATGLNAEPRHAVWAALILPFFTVDTRQDGVTRAYQFINVSSTIKGIGKQMELESGI